MVSWRSKSLPHRVECPRNAGRVQTGVGEMGVVRQRIQTKAEKDDGTLLWWNFTGRISPPQRQKKKLLIYKDEKENKTTRKQMIHCRMDCRLGQLCSFDGGGSCGVGFWFLKTLLFHGDYQRLLTDNRYTYQPTREGWPPKTGRDLPMLGGGWLAPTDDY